MVGAIEAAGTKFVCAVGTGPDDLAARVAFPTTTPAETTAQAIAFLREQAAARPLAAVGIASFGPLDLDPASPTFGYLTTTPKPGWRQVDLVGPVREALGIPVVLDTDVNAAALAERRWGAAHDVDTFVYITVGTGIGGGGMVEGYPHDTGGKKVSVLYNGTRTLFEEVGFDYIRPKGQRNGVMRATVPPLA